MIVLEHQWPIFFIFEVNEHVCALVPGWVNPTVRVLLLVDSSDISRRLMLETTQHIKQGTGRGGERAS